jgi:hypothetical protein
VDHEDRWVTLALVGEEQPHLADVSKRHVIGPFVVECTGS